MPLTATRFLRKMRGGAQAHLLATHPDSGGACYVTKFLDNPQHSRILVNEWIGSHLLEYLRVASPRVALVEVSPEFLVANEDVYFQTGGSRRPVTPGWHLGSMFPGNPHTEAVYDYLPDSLLPQVVNLRDFIGALAFDRWTSNSDARQAIFFRRRIRDWLDDPSLPTLQKGFIAQMVDHGYLFDGPHWSFSDAPLQGLYPRPLVYQQVRSLDDFQPWLDRILTFPDSVFDHAMRTLPAPWIGDDRLELERLLERLFNRRQRVPDLLLQTVNARPQFFSNWVR